MIGLLAQISAGAPSPPTWTGSLPTWLILAMAVLVAWRVTKGGGGAAVSELTQANDVLTRALDKEREQGVDRQKRIEALEAKTDIVLAVSPLLADHEKRAQERHEATLLVLRALADSVNGISELRMEKTP